MLNEETVAVNSQYEVQISSEAKHQLTENKTNQLERLQKWLTKKKGDNFFLDS